MNAIGKEGDVRVVLVKYIPLDKIEEMTKAEIEKISAAPPALTMPAKPGQPAPGSDKPGAPTPGAPTEKPATVAREAAAVFYAQALERHQKRVTGGMDAEKSMDKLQTDCDAAAAFLKRAGLKGPNGALKKSAAAVLVGQPPETAAEFLAAALESTP
jgi:hypothetical protein